MNGTVLSPHGLDSENMNMLDAEFVSRFYKLLPLIFSLSGISLAFILYEFQSKFLFQIKTLFFFKKVYNFLNKKWFFDKIYNDESPGNTFCPKISFYHFENCHWLAFSL